MLDVRPLMSHLLDHFDQRLSAWLIQRGETAYRAGQVRRWVFARRADDFAAMSDLPAALREALAADFELWTTQVVKHLKADDGTEKLLLQLADGHRIECVLLRQGPQRRTICISTQVGCAMGCVFCASGLDGVARNRPIGEAPVIPTVPLISERMSGDSCAAKVRPSSHAGFSFEIAAHR